MNTITPLTSVPAVDSSTARSGGQNRQQFAKQGQIFKAFVFEARGANTFILDIGGNKIEAHAKIPLSVGQTLQLQVITTSPTPELKIISDSSNLFQGKSITLLGQNIDIKALFQSLQTSTQSPLEKLTTFSRQTIESFFHFKEDGLTGKDAGSLLKKFINRIGVSLETLLEKGESVKAQQTLKSALLELSTVFKSAEDVTENTNKLLNTIELYQHAQLQLNKDNILIFPLPLPFLQKGYLILEDKTSNSDENATESDEERFSLHLALESLGNLRIDFLQNQQGVFIKFISDSQASLDFIESLKGNLINSGISIPLLGLSFSHESIDPAADLLKRLVPQGESLVNTKA